MCTDSIGLSVYVYWQYMSTDSIGLSVYEEQTTLLFGDNIFIYKYVLN